MFVIVLVVVAVVAVDRVMVNTLLIDCFMETKRQNKHLAQIKRLFVHISLCYSECVSVCRLLSRVSAD